MKELSFNAKLHEVRGILDGRQSQFRRVVKPQPDFPVIVAGDPQTHRYGMPGREAMTLAQLLRLCPYGQPGDRLWVRETLRKHGQFGFPLAECPQVRPIQGRIWSYAADEIPDHTGTVPSIHMPRWASRITLEITGVRVERLQDISEADAKAEGAPFELAPLDSVRLGAMASHRGGFERIWQSINGPDSWQANPWVWVIEFKRVTP